MTRSERAKCAHRVCRSLHAGMRGRRVNPRPAGMYSRTATHLVIALHGVQCGIGQRSQYVGVRQSGERKRVHCLCQHSRLPTPSRAAARCAAASTVHPPRLCSCLHVGMDGLHNIGSCVGRPRAHGCAARLSQRAGYAARDCTQELSRLPVRGGRSAWRVQRVAGAA